MDRGVYEQLDFRTAKHPSESDAYLLTRVLAYALNYQDGIEFSSGGLSDPDGPAVFVNGVNGEIALWIEIGNPSAKKLHRASKASDQVKVYTYKDPANILREVQAEKVHRVEEIEVISFAPVFLERLAKDLPRDIRWQVLHHEGVLTVGAGEKSEQTEIQRLRLTNGF